MWEYIMNENQNKPVRDFINGINIEENSSVGVDFHDGDEYMDDNLYHVMAGMPKTCYSKYTPKIMAYILMKKTFHHNMVGVSSLCIAHDYFYHNIYGPH